MRHVPGAFNEAMADAEGRFGPAAAHLADRLEWDDELRKEASALLIACLLLPARHAHAHAFELDTGKTVDEFVARYAGLEEPGE